MKIPWKLPQCNYPGCNYKVRKREESHCKAHYEEILAKVGSIIARQQRERSHRAYP